VGGLCIIGFLVGLPLTCPGGPYLLDLLDYYSATWPYLFIGLSELVIISYVYGYSNYIDDLVEITKSTWLYKIKPVLGVFYCFLSPAIISVIFCVSWYNYAPFTKAEYSYPAWANGIGWIIALTCILAVPVAALYLAVKEVLRTSPRSRQDWLDSWKTLTGHTAKWRANALRANIRDGEQSLFEYTQPKGGSSDQPPIRHRRTTRALSGYDNNVIRNSLTDL